MIYTAIDSRAFDLHHLPFNLHSEPSLHNYGPPSSPLQSPLPSHCSVRGDCLQTSLSDSVPCLLSMLREMTNYHGIARSMTIIKTSTFPPSACAAACQKINSTLPAKDITTSIGKRIRETYEICANSQDIMQRPSQPPPLTLNGHCYHAIHCIQEDDQPRENFHSIGSSHI